MKDKVKEWYTNSFGDIFKGKANLKIELKNIQDIIQSDGYLVELLKEDNEKLVSYHDLVSREETFWR